MRHTAAQNPGCFHRGRRPFRDRPLPGWRTRKRWAKALPRPARSRPPPPRSAARQGQSSTWAFCGCPRFGLFPSASAHCLVPWANAGFLVSSGLPPLSVFTGFFQRSYPIRRKTEPEITTFQHGFLHLFCHPAHGTKYPVRCAIQAFWTGFDRYTNKKTTAQS